MARSRLRLNENAVVLIMGSLLKVLPTVAAKDARPSLAALRPSLRRRVTAPLLKRPRHLAYDDREII